MKKCKYCKLEIDSDAKICPNCKKKQGKSMWLIVLIVIISIGIIASLGSNDDTDHDNNNETKSQPVNSNTNNEQQEIIEYIKLTKDELDDELENNAAAAKEKYSKKYVEISGKLGTIDSDLKYIGLNSTTKEFDFRSIHCTIKNNDQKEIIKSLSNNQEIIIKGKITDVGEVLGYYLDITEIIVN